MRKLLGIALLAAFYFTNSSCSIPRNRQPVDVTGCGLIKWGMTIDQVKSLLGPKARVETDPRTGMKLETVTLRIGKIDLSGVVTTELHTERINGVGLFYKDGHPLQEQMFKNLKILVSENYGAPPIEYSLASTKTCFWGFPSGHILLMSYANKYVTLSYMQNPLGLNYQIPLQN